MARSRRRVSGRSRRSSEAEERSEGTGGFLQQIGLFETANGLPHGPGVVAMAVAVGLVAYPISRLVRSMVRRWPADQMRRR